MKQIVVVRQRPSIGDCLLLGPMIRQLKAKNPRSRLTVVTDNQWAAGAAPRIFANLPGVDAVECVASHEWTTDTNRDVDAMARLSGQRIPHTIRKAHEVYDCNGAFIQFERDHQGNPPYGIAEFWLRVFGLDPEDRLPRINIDPAFGVDWVAKNGITKPIIGLVLKAGAFVRDFDIQKLHTIAEWAHTSGYAVVTIDPIQKLSSHTTIPLIGEPIDNVGSVVQQMKVVLTPDTGIMHLAEAVGVPTVSLWGIMPPHLRIDGYKSIAVPKQCLGPCNDPGCKQCGWKFQQWSCMRRITPHMMIEGVEEAFATFHNKA